MNNESFPGDVPVWLSLILACGDTAKAMSLGAGESPMGGSFENCPRPEGQNRLPVGRHGLETSPDISDNCFKNVKI